LQPKRERIVAVGFCDCSVRLADTRERNRNAEADAHVL